MLLGMLLVTGQSGFSQQNPAVRAQTNVQQLQSLSQQYNMQYQQAFRQAREVALRYGLPVHRRRLNVSPDTHRAFLRIVCRLRPSATNGTNCG